VLNGDEHLTSRPGLFDPEKLRR